MKINKQKHELDTVQHPANSYFMNLTGQVFNRFTVIKYAGNKYRTDYWYCECSCGNIAKVSCYSLIKNKSKSCGCYNKQRSKETHTTHGHSVNYKTTNTFVTWQSMLQRCNNPKHKNYYRYGGRGIKVCERWLIFENFLEDMGERPDNLTLDRKENNKGYYKENCRWATNKEQSLNKRNNHYLQFNDKNLTLSQWAELLGFNKGVIRGRLQKGWSIEKALNTPQK